MERELAAVPRHLFNSGNEAEYHDNDKAVSYAKSSHLPLSRFASDHLPRSKGTNECKSNIALWWNSQNPQFRSTVTTASRAGFQASPTGAIHGGQKMRSERITIAHARSSAY